MHDHSITSDFHKSSSNPYRPNTAAIPNILFDYWMAKLGTAEFKVLMAIARKTYGWNKTKDRISIRQLTDLTGLHKSNVIKATEQLVDLGLVVKFKSKGEYGDLPNEYEINVDFCEKTIDDGGGAKKEGGVAQNDTPRVAQNDTQNPLSTKPNDDDDTHTHVGCGNVYNSPHTKTDTKGNFYKIYYSDWVKYCVNEKTPWDASIMDASWKALLKWQDPLDDWLTFLIRESIKLTDPPVKQNIYKVEGVPKQPTIVEKTKPNGQKVQCSQEEYFKYCVNTRKDFTTEEILDAWSRFTECKAQIGDWKKYIDQIIINKRQGEKSCNLQTKKEKIETKDSKKESENFKEKTLAKDLREQPYQKREIVSDQALLNRFKEAFKAKRTS